MKGGRLNARGLLLLLGLGGVLIAAVGCGSSGNDEVTVQTGSLAKAKFIKKADAICEAAQGEFGPKYQAFLRKHKAEITGSKKKLPTLYSEYLKAVLTPYVERQIKEISQLGAPENYAPEVASFLNAFQDKLDEVQADPTKLEATVYPFDHAEALAKKAGLNGCTPTT